MENAVHWKFSYRDRTCGECGDFSLLFLEDNLKRLWYENSWKGLCWCKEILHNYEHASTSN